MKKTAYLFLLAAYLVTLLIGCSQPEVPSSTDEHRSDKEIFESEISLQEKQRGITFFKKDIVITDPAGRNQVTMKFACEDETVLNSYLEDIKYEIVPVYKGQMPKLNSTGSNVSDEQYSQAAPLTKTTSAVLTEEVSRKLQDGAIGFYLTVKRNPQTRLKTLAREGYAYTSNHLSGEDWSEKLHFIRNNNGPGNNIHYFLKCKDGGLFASWYTPPTLHNILNGPGGQLPNDFFLTYPGGVFPGVDVVYDIDGPKKHQLVVDHNGYADYSFFFENY